MSLFSIKILYFFFLKNALCTFLSAEWLNIFCLSLSFAENLVLQSSIQMPIPFVQFYTSQCQGAGLALCGSTAPCLSTSYGEFRQPVLVEFLLDTPAKLLSQKWLKKSPIIEELKNTCHSLKMAWQDVPWQVPTHTFTCTCKTFSNNIIRIIGLLLIICTLFCYQQLYIF